MPRGKWIDKKTAQHFTLVHRPQNDPLINDENAPSMVLNPTQKKTGTSAVRNLADLSSEFGYENLKIKSNEGEAENYGVYFDDTEYDYMQHLRDLNTGSGESVFVEADTKNNGKGKQKQSLEEALEQLNMEKSSDFLLDEVILPSKNLTRLSYEAQQNVPEAIRGFQPDMDPRLREALEALDDEAYVEEDDDFFQQLAADGKELDDVEFKDALNVEDDEGWESDATAKPCRETEAEPSKLVNDLDEHPDEGPPQDWMKDFQNFENAAKVSKANGPMSQSEVQSTWTTTTNGGRQKRRKGALTNASSYSMTSSLMRTEQMTLLDARFEKLDEQYSEDLEDDIASVSAVSTASSVAGPLRGDFDGILDDFLGNYTKPGKRTSKKNRAQTGLQQLDEIRRELGPARIQARR